MEPEKTTKRERFHPDLTSDKQMKSSSLEGVTDLKEMKEDKQKGSNESKETNPVE